MKLIWDAVTFSATIAIAPLLCPTICSPNINSSVVVDALVIEAKTAVGAEASSIVDDSNIPWISIISGVFKDMTSSWTLVPQAKLPYSNPSFKVVEPIPETLVPEPPIVDLSTTIVLTLFLIFSFEVGLSFVIDVNKVASTSLEPNP